MSALDALNAINQELGASPPPEAPAAPNAPAAPAPQRGAVGAMNAIQDVLAGKELPQVPKPPGEQPSTLGDYAKQAGAGVFSGSVAHQFGLNPVDLGSAAMNAEHKRLEDLAASRSNPAPPERPWWGIPSLSDLNPLNAADKRMAAIAASKTPPGVEPPPAEPQKPGPYSSEAVPLGGGWLDKKLTGAIFPDPKNKSEELVREGFKGGTEAVGQAAIVPRVAGALFGPAAAAGASKFIGKPDALNFGIGAGAGVGSDLLANSGYVPDQLKTPAAIIGALLGAAPAVALHTGYQAIREAANTAGGRFTQSGRELATGRELQTAAGANAPQVLENLQGKGAADVPSVPLTTGQQSADRGVINWAQGVEQKAPAQFAGIKQAQQEKIEEARTAIQPTGSPEALPGMMKEQRDEVAAATAAVTSHAEGMHAQALDNFRNLAPDTPPTVLVDHLRDIRDSADAITAARIIEARQGAQKAAGDVTSNLDAEDLGNAGRTALSDSQKVASNAANAMYGVIERNNVHVPSASVASDAKGILDNISPAAKAPTGEEESILGYASGLSSKTPFKDMKALKTRIMNLAAEPSTDPETLGRIGLLRKSIENSMDHGLEQHLTSEAIDRKHGVPTTNLGGELHGVANEYAAQSDRAAASDQGGAGAGAGQGSAPAAGEIRAAGAPDVQPGNAARGEGVSARPGKDVAGAGGAGQAGAVELRTGKPNVDAVLADPKVDAAIKNPQIERAGSVPDISGASKEGMTTHIDKGVPEKVKLSRGEPFDPAIPLNIHEQVEKHVMETMIADFKEKNGRAPSDAETQKIYETAHRDYATPAEEQWYKDRGLPLDEVKDFWESQNRRTQAEGTPTDVNPDLYRKVYPGGVVKGEEAHGRVETPTGKGADTADIPDERLTPKQVLDKYRGASGLYRWMMETYGRGIVGTILKKAERGGFNLSDAKVASKLWTKGDTGAEGVRAIRTALDPETADKILSDAATFSFDKAAIRDGVVKPDLAGKWAREHASALGEMPPELQAKFKNASTAEQAVADAHAERKAKLEAFDKSEAGKLAGLEGSQDIVGHVGKILDDKATAAQKLGELAKAAKGNPAAQEGLEKAVLEHVFTKLGADSQGLDKVGAFLDAKQEALSHVLTPEKFQEIRDRLGAAQATAKTTDAMKQLGEASTKVAADGILGKIMKVQGKENVLDVLGRMFKSSNSTNEAALLMKKAKNVDGGVEAVRKGVTEMLARDYTNTARAGVGETYESARARTDAFFRKNTDTLEKVLTPEQVGALRAIVETEHKINRTANAIKAKGSDTMQNKLAAQAHEGQSNYGHLALDAVGIYAGEKLGEKLGAGLLGPAAGWAAAHFIGALKNAGYKKLMDVKIDAAMHPDLAAAYLKRAMDAPIRNTQALIYTRMRQLGLAVATAGKDQQSQ